MSAWEYKTVVRSAQEMLTEEQLNAMGANGFELLQVLHFEEHMMVVGRRETVNKIHYFFKRALQAQPQAAKPATPTHAAPKPAAPKPAAPAATAAPATKPPPLQFKE